MRHEIATQARDAKLAAIRDSRQYRESSSVGVCLTVGALGKITQCEAIAVQSVADEVLDAVWEAETVLLAQHDSKDVLLTSLAFATSGLSHRLELAGDGDEAIAYLSRKGRFGNRRRYSFPVLLLLDLVLPRVSGLEVLQWKEQRSELHNLPVVALATPGDPTVQKAMELGAVSCLTKPPQPEALRDVIHQFDTQWLTGAGVLSEIGEPHIS